MVTDRLGTAAARRPASGQRALLAHTNMRPLRPISILNPDLQRSCLGMLALDFIDHPGKVFKGLVGCRICFGMDRPGDGVQGHHKKQKTPSTIPSFHTMAKAQ